MPYNDFSLESLTTILAVTAEPADLFGDLAPVAVPPWLREQLGRGMRQVLLSEKARSEFIVVPILLACQELSPSAVAIYSGQRLDVDPERGLVGECDFILAATSPVPALRAPLMPIAEAKRNEVESGVWQCVAQMVGARLFNERSGRPLPEVYGCVTNGEAWQFLRLAGSAAGIDRRRYYIDNVGGILAVLRMIVSPAPNVATLPAQAGPSRPVTDSVADRADVYAVACETRAAATARRPDNGPQEKPS